MFFANLFILRLATQTFFKQSQQFYVSERQQLCKFMTNTRQYCFTPSTIKITPAATTAYFKP